MADRIIRLGPGECPDIETGARFFAALAFPGANEGQARHDAVCAWVGSYLHEANRIDKSNDPFEDTRLNAFAQLPPAWCRAKLRTTRRRLKDRSNLARAVRPWMRDLLNEPHRPIPGIKKFTQRQIALYLCADNPEHADNFQKRVWRPGRTVLHVLVATDLLLSTTYGAHTDFPIGLASVALIEELVRRSNLAQTLICKDPRFGVAAEDLLQFDWVK